ncbi:MAG: DUF488 family protein [Gammaproteobacteria bacterium]|nr:MAG: DUF488 family protein [Gammaproteobacteria bacterium]
MAISIVRLGSDRRESEGVRIGTVRRPPRGVKKSDYASGNWFDVWLPILSPSPELMKVGQASVSDRDWAAFVKRFRRELSAPDASRTLDLLVALSHSSDFSVGCYCENEARCHRSVLRDVLLERGACVRGA